MQSGKAIIFLLVCTVPLAAVMRRHDVADSRYRSLAQALYLRPGLVVTRPRAAIPGGGVLVHREYILTAGHVGSSDGPADMPVRFQGREYRIDRVHLFPGYAAHGLKSGGNDLALLHIADGGITTCPPARVWAGGVSPGERIRGVGQGKSGTGRQNDEPLAAGTFRGYENSVDLVLGPEHWHLFITDFDAPDGSGNSLTANLFFLNRKIKGVSSPLPLSLEGAIAAGDSGSGIWITRNGRHCLAGIATGRHYSCYGGQSLYVNLGNREIAGWIRSIIIDINFFR